MNNPGALPVSAPATLESGILVISSDFIVATEPVRLIFLTDP